MTPKLTTAGKPRMLDTVTRNIIDSPAEPAFDRVTRLISQMLDVPVAMFSVADEDRLVFKSSLGMSGPYAESRVAPLNQTACQFVIRSGKPLPVEDARTHELLRNQKLVQELGVKGYLGYPICSPGGLPFGSLCAVADGTRRWTERDIEVLGTLAMAIEAEVALRTAVASRDSVVTELRAAYAALEAARGIEEALDERTRFFTSLSHEIRTPLNHLLGGVALLQIAESDSDREQYGRMIQDSAVTLTRFVDDLVGYARNRSGRDTVNMKSFDPRRPVEFTLRSVAGGAAEKGLDLVSDVDPDLPENWMSDSTRLESLLINLAGNAIKFTSRGSITIAVRAEQGRLVYRVSDTGPGIAADYHTSIFEPFERGDPVLSLKTNGSGLGLSIARSSARLIGADLYVEESAVGVGTTFAISVPAWH